jgi:hypothetical protein
LKKTIFLAILFIASISVHCQEAQKGYYITNTNQKVEGYFKPTDFFDVTSLKFKRALESDYISLPANGITEYAIGNNSKNIPSILMNLLKAIKILIMVKNLVL